MYRYMEQGGETGMWVETCAAVAYANLLEAMLCEESLTTLRLSVYVESRLESYSSFC